MSRSRRHSARLRRLLAWTLLLACLGCVACASLRRADTALSEEELRQALGAFSARFASVVSGAGQRIRDATTDPEIRRRVLLWEIQLVPLVQESAFLPDPQEAFVAVNGVVVMQRRYLKEGDGATVFAEYQPIAIEAAERLEDEFYEVARLFLSDQEVVRLRAEVDAYSKQRAISGRDFTVANVHRQAREVRQSGRFDWVINVPMSPFRALEGVGSGAAAIHDFNDTALRFSRIVEGLPQQMRWQSSLLLYDVESRESLIRVLSELESFAESARRLAAVAERLPADLETVLGGSEGMLAQAQQTLLSAERVVGPLRGTAEQVALAGESWAPIFERDGEPDPEARPFDIREYESAARSIGEAATELNGLAVELAALIESPGLATTLGGISATVAGAESGGRGVVDHAAWRGLQLLLLSFVLLLIYRLVAWRLGRAG